MNPAAAEFKDSTSASGATCPVNAVSKKPQQNTQPQPKARKQKKKPNTTVPPMVKNCLVVGTGGDSNLISRYLALDPRVNFVYLMPGNASMSYEPKLINVKSIKNLADLAAWAKKHEVGMVVYLVPNNEKEGIKETFAEFGVKYCLYPTKKAGELESKAQSFSDFMIRHEIPHAKMHFYDAVSNKDLDPIDHFLSFMDFTPPRKSFYHKNALGYSRVEEIYPTPRFHIKKTGREGKQQTRNPSSLPKDKTQARLYLTRALRTCESDESIYIQEHRQGDIVSICFLADGQKGYRALPATQVEKMGCIAPVETLKGDAMEEIKKRILDKLMQGMFQEKRPLMGMIMIKVVITSSGPEVISFQNRWGELETQALLPLINLEVGVGLAACMMACVAKRHVDQLKLKIIAKISTTTILSTSNNKSILRGSFRKPKLVSQEAAHVYYANSSVTESSDLTPVPVLMVTAWARDLEVLLKNSEAECQRQVDNHKKLGIELSFVPNGTSEQIRHRFKVFSDSDIKIIQENETMVEADECFKYMYTMRKEGLEAAQAKAAQASADENAAKAKAAEAKAAKAKAARIEAAKVVARDTSSTAVNPPTSEAYMEERAMEKVSLTIEATEVPDLDDISTMAQASSEIRVFTPELETTPRAQAVGCSLGQYRHTLTVPLQSRKGVRSRSFSGH